MKSVKIKILTLALSALMILPTLAACGEVSEGKETQAGGTTAVGSGESGEAPAESETEAGPTVDKKDYKNAEFVTLYCSDTFNKGYFLIEEEERRPGNDLDDKIYERMLSVEEYLGVDIVPVDGGIYTAYTTEVTNSVSAGDDSYQLVLTHVYQGVANFITQNQIRPYNDFESINLDASYWKKDLMEDLAINDNMYLGYSDFCLSNCYVIGFNKSMVKEYANTIGNLYEQVENKQWTLTKFMEYSSLVYKDTNGNSTADEGDTYGFAGFAWVPLISFQTAADIPVVARDPEDDHLYISPLVDNAEKIVKLDEMIYNFVNDQHTFTWDPFTGGAELHLDSGRVMFETVNNYGLVTTKETDIKVGVLPYPLWDENQANYKTLSWNGYMVIPTTVKNLEMVGDTIEMLAYSSDAVTTAFYETLLGAKVADAPEDVKMLDIIWSSQTSDYGLAFNNVDASLDAILYALAHHVSVAGTPAYSTYVRSKTRTAERALERMFTQAE